MKNPSYATLLITALLLLTACSATTRLESVQDNASIAINQDKKVSLEQSIEKTYPTTSFGQYVFKITTEENDPFVGLMPLKFNGGYLAADILFFAPAAFFNLREVFPYYQFDAEKEVLRYKKTADAPWVDYKPTEAEQRRAKNYFENKEGTAGH